MKKHVSILLGLMVIFSSLFTSCNEGELELDPNICKITVKSEGNGKVAITDYIGTSVNVLIGNRVEVVATPDEGWACIGWYVSGSESPVSTDASFTFITSENVTLTARFAKLSDIIIRSGGNGSVAFKDAAGNSMPVVLGTEVTVIATPDNDCDFVGWFVGDSETPISTEKVYTFTATENIILTGQFSKRPIVTVRSAGNGSVSIKDAYGTSKVCTLGTEVTVIATPYKNCDFTGWFIDDSESPISADMEYTFTLTEDIILTAKFNKRPLPIGEAVDLGLSVKWASLNIGAYSPEESGGYYAWGETQKKECYNISTYKWCNASDTTITKYCIDSYYGNLDNKTILDPEDDVAHVKWGDSWRIPTSAELDELRNKCIWTWTSLSGVEGYKVTGTNGNSIFLPAAGYYLNRSLIFSGVRGYYWSSSLYSYNNHAFCLNVSSDNYSKWYYGYRESGYCVRPVCE